MPDRLARMLVDLALELHRRQPWTKVPADAPFLIRVPDKESPLVAILTGQAKSDSGVVVLRGERAFSGFLEMLHDPSGRLMSERGDLLSVTFEPLAAIPDELRSTLREAGFSARREQAAPHIMVSRPGRRARAPSRGDMRTLVQCLRGILTADEQGTLRPVPPDSEHRWVLELRVTDEPSSSPVESRVVPWPESGGDVRTSIGEAPAGRDESLEVISEPSGSKKSDGMPETSSIPRNLRAGQMENTLYQLYLKETETFRWFANLDAESARQLLLSTWYVMLWNPVDADKSLLKFYGHTIDGPSVMRFLQTLKRRYAYCEMYAWAIPNKEAIDTLLTYSPLIEVGAGRGYWAALASSAGADIIAFDPDPPTKGGVNKWHRQPGMFFNVARAGLEIARMHPDRTLLLCWPPCQSDVALRTLQNYNGKTVIYVGDEGHDAGTPQFYAEMAAHFTMTRVVDIPRWPGVNDRLEVWQRSDVTPSTT